MKSRIGQKDFGAGERWELLLKFSSQSISGDAGQVPLATEALSLEPLWGAEPGAGEGQDPRRGQTGVAGSREVEGQRHWGLPRTPSPQWALLELPARGMFSSMPKSPWLAHALEQGV